MLDKQFHIKGLTDEQIIESRKKFGTNQLSFKKHNGFIDALFSIFKEPMVILLLVASSIYFMSGKTGDGFFLLSATILVSIISIYQDSRSRNALAKLKQMSQPNCRVIRNSEIKEIKIEQLVIGDYLMVEEGALISADGIIIQSNDFSVNESILTGESLPVYKEHSQKDHFIYKGTLVTSGMAIATVNAIGMNTKLGKIGKSIESIEEEKTPLEIQINHFVKKMATSGAIVFTCFWMINYAHSKAIIDSLLNALTLAMSILPEEIPLALTTFMALGAWRLMKMGIIVKQMKTVETLGSATVICTDKTGTLTENKMSLAKLYSLKSNKITNAQHPLEGPEKELLRIAMFASEPIPFDPMEKALHDAYKKSISEDERAHYKMMREYPLSGKPPMMTHLFENNQGHRIIAAKGAPEAIMRVSVLSETDKKCIEEAIHELTIEGYRILGVCESEFSGHQFPQIQQEFQFQFKGIVAFYDPPKPNIQSVLEQFYVAGIDVKIVTGDNAATTSSIAKQIGFKGYDKILSGDELMKLSDDELAEKVLNIHLFTRMFPEAKLKIINALKSKNQIVAMTGDGVNDGPALKAAHIGIAMGKKGTEIAKEAAALILIEDDLSKMVEAIAMGRKIYINLKKAIQYVISIHIPIILTVFIPLAMDWKYPSIFSPIHVIFFELIMGPTCSIIYENEPIEKNIMMEKPRPFTMTFFSWKELYSSVLQGLMMTIGNLLIYQYAIYKGYNEPTTRAIVFTTLISANICLTLVNRSFYYSIFTTLKYKNNLVLFIILITIMISALILYVKPIRYFFELEYLNVWQLLMSIGCGFLFVIWFEFVKMNKRLSKQSE